MDTKQIFENKLYKALETYANVHRGSGFKSVVSTHLYEKTRELVLNYLGLSADRYHVVFCSSRAASLYLKQFKEGECRVLSDQKFGLNLGIRALVFNKKHQPEEAVYYGGGTTRLIGNDWLMWGKSPEKYEAGSPAVMQVIALGIAIQMALHSGIDDIFTKPAEKEEAHEIMYTDQFQDLKGDKLLHELQKNMVGTSVEVPTIAGTVPFVNLDNSASTPALKPVWDAYIQTLWQPKENRQAIIAETEKICHNFLEAPSTEYDLCFTMNTTESVNIAAENLAITSTAETDNIVLCSSAEHSSNDLPWRKRGGQRVVHLKSSNEGFIDYDELEETLKAYNRDNLYGNAKIKMVSLTGASNVLGSCIDIAKASSIVHKYNALLHIDAAQLVAHNSIDMQSWGIDFLSFSAHKIYAPFGTGVLIAKKELINFDPQQWNAIKTFGEENAAGIAALGKSLHLFQRIGLQTIHAEEQKMLHYLLVNFPTNAKLQLHGISTANHQLFNRKLGVVPFDIKDASPKKLAQKLNLIGGIGVRYGCHCAHIIVKQILHIGPRLEKFQRFILRTFPKLELQGVVRVSLGLENSTEQIDRFVSTLNYILHPKDSDLKPLHSKASIEKYQKSLIQEIEHDVFHNLTNENLKNQTSSATTHSLA